MLYAVFDNFHELVNPIRQDIIRGGAKIDVFGYRKLQLQVEVYNKKINCLYKTFSYSYKDYWDIILVPNS